MNDVTLFEAAAAARDEGIRVSADNAGTEWQDAALSWLRGYLVTHARLLPDDARHGGCPVPPSGEWRALGAVFKKAARQGWMHRDGWAPRASGHLSPGPVWRSNIWNGLA